MEKIVRLMDENIIKLKNLISQDSKLSKSEIAIAKYDTLKKIVDQLESCNYEAVGGYLNNNVAFIALKRMVEHGS